MSGTSGNVPYSYITQQHQLERIAPKFMDPQHSWGFDVETTGLDPHKDKVCLMQIGRRECCYLIDTRKVNIEPLRPFLESNDHKKIGHNLKFDYKFIKGSFGIELDGLRDTFLALKLLTAGVTHYLSKDHKLDKVLKKYLDVDIEDKEEMQKSFINHVGDFTTRQLEYAAGDVIYMNELLKILYKDIVELRLLETFLMECRVLPAFGDMEFDGMPIDKEKWKNNITINTLARAKTKEEMDKIVTEVMGGDLFGDFSSINYGSPKQVVNLLQSMNLKVKIWDPIKRVEVESLVKKSDNDTLKKLKQVPIVKLLQQYRSYDRKVCGFGQSYLDAINPKTGCIHPQFWQIGTATGRTSAGDSDVNPLNIPREQAYRDCFICAEDEVVETDDFSGCESRILAHISGDPQLLSIFERGEDIHCGAATLLYGVPVTKKNENKHLRTPAKALNFGRPRG